MVSIHSAEENDFVARLCYNDYKLCQGTLKMMPHLNYSKTEEVYCKKQNNDYFNSYLLYRATPCKYKKRNYKLREIKYLLFLRTMKLAATSTIGKTTALLFSVMIRRKNWIGHQKHHHTHHPNFRGTWVSRPDIPTTIVS